MSNMFIPSLYGLQQNVAQQSVQGAFNQQAPAVTSVKGTLVFAQHVRPDLQWDVMDDHASGCRHIRAKARAVNGDGKIIEMYASQLVDMSDMQNDDGAVYRHIIEDVGKRVDHAMSKGLRPASDVEALLALTKIDVSYSSIGDTFTLVEPPHVGPRSLLPPSEIFGFVQRQAPIEEWRDMCSKICTVRELRRAHPSIEIRMPGSNFVPSQPPPPPPPPMKLESRLGLDLDKWT